jgi:multidrug efflux system membrane fusion protein
MLKELQPRMLAGGALCVLLASCGSTTRANSTASAAAPASAPGVPVRVAEAIIQQVPVEIATVGNVEAWSTIEVRAQIGGVLTKAHFTEGQMVKAGDLLFEIDARPYLEAIRQWEANQARDEANLRLAEANLARAESQATHFGKQADRYTQLADQGIFSREVADQATVEARARRTGVRAETANIEAAKAAIRADEAALANARLNLTYCTIKSPITGRTGAVKVKEGNLVKANDADLVTIHQIQPIYVAFSVPEEHLSTIRARGGKLPVSASVPGDPRPAGRGTLSFLDNAVDASTGTIRLKATFANETARYWPGQFVDVRLRLEDRPNSVVVPAGSLQTGQQGNYVYVVRPDKSVELRVVTPGPRAGDVIAIAQGLQAGETVVTEGQLRLAPNMKIAVLP